MECGACSQRYNRDISRSISLGYGHGAPDTAVPGGRTRYQIQHSCTTCSRNPLSSLLDDNFDSSGAPVFLRHSAMSFPSPAAYASPSSDQATREASTGQTSAPGKARPHPCTACKKSKVKCDERRPVCDRCTRRDYRVSLDLMRLCIEPHAR